MKSVLGIILLAAVIASGCFAQENSPGEFRYWKTNAGKRSSIRLMITAKTRETVTLKREDSAKVVKLTISDLSIADQQYVQNWRKTRTSVIDTAGTSRNWPRFRGVGGLGVSDVKGLPTTWDENTNVRWKVEMPGPGLSSPVVWGDHVYVTCFTGYDWPLDNSQRRRTGDLERHLLCVDLNNGRILWQRSDRAENYKPDLEFNKVHLRYHGYASNTGACDENGVYAFFGADGVFAFSHDGDPLWNTSVGESNNNNGSGTSLIAEGGKIFVPAVAESVRLFALDAKTGKEIWQYRRVDSFSTPTVQVRDGNSEVLYKYGAKMMAFDTQTGEKNWEFDQGGKGDACASIISSGGRIYAVHSWDRSVRAHQLDGETIWEMQGEGPNFCTPLLIDERLFVIQKNVFTLLDAATGDRIKRERLPFSGECFGSPVSADDKIYVTHRDQGVLVLDRNSLEVLAQNKFDDESKFDATPAITPKGLIFRSNRNLYCVANE